MNSKGLAIAFQVGAGSLCDMAQPFCSADSLVSSLIEVPDGCGGELAVNPSAVVAWTCPARNSTRQSDTSACCCLQAQTENKGIPRYDASLSKEEVRGGAHNALACMVWMTPHRTCMFVLLSQQT